MDQQRDFSNFLEWKHFFEITFAREVEVLLDSCGPLCFTRFVWPFKVHPIGVELEALMGRCEGQKKFVCMDY